jgi:hypothetical protein
MKRLSCQWRSKDRREENLIDEEWEGEGEPCKDSLEEEIENLCGDVGERRIQFRSRETVPFTTWNWCRQ